VRCALQSPIKLEGNSQEGYCDMIGLSACAMPFYRSGDSIVIAPGIWRKCDRLGGRTARNAEPVLFLLVQGT